MRMHNPPHPGEVLKTLCLEPLKVSVTEAAKALGVSRKTLSAILNGRAGISPEMAVRLSIAFGTSAESWLNQQRNMTSGMPNSAAKNFVSERSRLSKLHGCLLDSHLSMLLKKFRYPRGGGEAVRLIAAAGAVVVDTSGALQICPRSRRRCG